MHDSFTPLGGLVPMWLMQLGEVVFGGVGSGLYGMLIFAIVAVFIAGLMVGRTPEYLGKKIEAYEMKMASLAILVPSGAGPRRHRDRVRRARRHGGARRTRAPHGFSEILYAFSSAVEQQRLAPSRASPRTRPSTPPRSALCMLVGRYWVIVPVLAIAGSLARKKLVPPSAGHAADPRPALRRAARRARSSSSARSPSSRRSRSARSSSTCMLARAVSESDHVDKGPTAASALRAGHRPRARSATRSGSSTRAA